MTLLDLFEGDIAVIRALKGDLAQIERLRALGLYSGRRVRFIRSAPFSGPILVEDQISGARVMIARALADNVEVADECAAVT